MTVKCPFCDQEIVDSPRVSVHDAGVLIDGKEIWLPRSERLLLEALFEKYPRVVTRDALMARLYGETDYHDTTNILNVFICKLRKYLKGADCKIETAWGRGFRLVLP